MTRFDRQCYPQAGNKVRLKQDAWAWMEKRDSSGRIIRNLEDKTVLVPYSRYGARKGDIAIVMRKHPDYVCDPNIPVYQIKIKRYGEEENLVQTVPYYIIEVIE